VLRKASQNSSDCTRSETQQIFEARRALEATIVRLVA
jgi:DNA-binding GntR family transcriptional regulator